MKNTTHPCVSFLNNLLIAPVCFVYSHEPFHKGQAFHPVCMCNCWWKSMGDLYPQSLQEPLINSTRSCGQEAPSSLPPIGVTEAAGGTWASTSFCGCLPKPWQLRIATRVKPVTFVFHISLYGSWRSHTRLLIRSVAIYSGCATHSWGQRSWWSFFWGSCLWCPSMSSCTDYVVKSTQKGLKQLCCKLSTWKWFPSGNWWGPQRTIQQVCGNRKVERVNIHIKWMR